VIEASRVAEAARLAASAREAAEAAAAEAAEAMNSVPEGGFYGMWRRLELQALNWGLESGVLELTGQKGGGPSFQEALKGYSKCTRVNQKFGYILTLLTIMNQPSFHNPVMEEYFSSPQVQSMARNVLNQTHVIYKIFKGGNPSSPSLISKHIVPGVGLARPSRKQKKKKRPTKKK